jgi:CubicO group peptidase (beta-lactamase class C family)
MHLTLLIFPLTNCQTTSVVSDLENTFDQIHLEEAFSGGILVVKEGQIQIHKSYGAWGEERQNALTNDNLFRIASITKPFTASAILLLQEEGGLDIDDSIDAYLPNLPWGSKITIKQLLNHTSGVSRDTVNQIEPKTDNESNYQTPEIMLKLIQDDPLDFSPGERYMYSNNGYQLLGMIIESVSGVSYEAFIRNEILEPLGLFNTGFDYFEDIAGELITGYLSSGPEIPINDKWYYGYAAIGMSSTMEDLFLWMKAYFEGNSVSPESRLLMTTPQISTGSANPLEKYYGLGWHIGTQKYPGGTTPVIHHSGDVPGFSSIAQYYPDLDLYIIAYSNDNANLGLFGYPGTVLYYLY